MSSFNDYKKELRFVESKNNYNAVNNITGALGAYQFMPSTLNSLQSIFNLPAWNDKNYFLSNTNLQDLYIDALIQDSINCISNNNLESYLGMPVVGSMRFKNLESKLTINGMLGAIHLTGCDNFISFLKTGVNRNDGFTSISDYAAYFSKHTNKLNYSLVLLAFIPAIILYYV